MSQTGKVGDGSIQNLALNVKGLYRSFGRTRILNGLDLEVPWGEVLTVLGPNGSGKTSLINILATLARPDSGMVRVAGLDVVRKGNKVRRMIGVVTHETGLYNALTGQENLKLTARMFGMDRIDERISGAMDRLGISARANQRVDTLSHGLRKRFAIARALLNDPPVLLMDEPESGLDQEALGLLEDVVKDKALPFRSVIATTHNFDRALDLSQRVAILYQGRIVYQNSFKAADRTMLKEAYFEYTGVESS